MNIDDFKEDFLKDLDPSFFLPTPQQTVVNPFDQQQQQQQHTTQQQAPPMDFMSTLQNQLYNIASDKQFEQEDVSHFFEGLDSSTYSVNPFAFQQPTIPQQQHYQQPSPVHQQQQQQQQMNPYQQHNFQSPRPFVPSPTSTFSTSSNSSSPHNFSGSPYTAPSNLIKLVQGFNRPLKEKQIGGKDNLKHPLPPQIIELSAYKLPTNSDPSVLSIRANVLGFDRVQRTKVILGHISDKPFQEQGSGPNAKWLAVFDDIIMQHSSHNNGQKLAIRFQLLDADKKPVCHVDTYEFETITKRGLEKIKERKRKRSDDDAYEAEVDNVEPPMGFSHGGQLVKLMGRNFVVSPSAQVVVTFGERNAREIHTVKRNYIICETPDHEPGKVEVNVELDKKKGQIATNATFHFIDPSDQIGTQELLKHLFKPSQSNDPPASSGNVNKKSRTDRSNGPTSISSWASGIETDHCGFNLLHHACARGYFELSYFLVENSFCDVNAVDNFGRTPLLWALWAKSYNVAAYLISYGVDMSLADDAGDTFLHVAANHEDSLSNENIHNVKKLLFWMMKFDDAYKTQTKFLLELLSRRNDDGCTPVQLAIATNNFILANLFTAVEQLCIQVINQSYIHLNNIRFRSGVLNGRTMKQVHGDQTSIVLELTRHNYILTTVRADRQVRSIIPNDKLAFIILDQRSMAAQFTLLSAPLVEEFQQGEWREAEDASQSILSFNLELQSSEQLQYLYSYVAHHGNLFEFQNMCFCNKPSTEDNKLTNKTGSASSNESKNEGLLRMKMNNLRITPSTEANHIN